MASSGQISLRDLINQPLPSVGTQLDMAEQPTAREDMADRLQSAAGDLGQPGNLTPLTAIVSGLTSGYADGVKNKEAEKRDKKLEAIRAQIAEQQQAAAQVDQIRQQLAKAQAADQLMMLNGKVVGNVLQTLELGDAQPAVDFVKSNPEVASLLGDDGPGGMEISSIVMDTSPKDGTKHIRAVWQNPDGTEVRGRHISFDGLLQRYAPDVYDLRTAQKLEEQKAAQARSLNDARVATERAQAGSYEVLAQQRTSPSVQPAPAATAPNALPEVTAGQKRAFEIQTKEAEKTKGQADVSTILDDITGKYRELEQKGGIVSTNNSGLENLVASAASSGVGQAAGGAFGTEEQSIRQSIRNSLPLLMSAIKNATGLSAQQMNSNAELQFYMQAATDPSKDIQSNLNAVENLRKMFAGGAQAQPDATPQLDNLKSKYGLE